MEDLDAFFDEVEEVEATAVEKEDQEERPTKKQKLVAPPARRGVVVAASAAAAAATSAVSADPSVASTPSNATGSAAGVPPPPPPPPPPPHAPPPPPPPPDTNNEKQISKKKPHLRTAAGKKWVDEKIGEWPDNDFRLFVGNLGNEVTDEMLLQHFQSKYPTCLRARVIRDAQHNTKGYGFVSFDDPLQMARGMREMDQTWLGARPIRVKRSQWQEREVKNKKKKNKNKRR